MKRKNISMILSIISLMSLSSCLNSNANSNISSLSSSIINNKVSSSITSSSNFSSTSTLKTYTITWENYDGEVLEVDNNVLYGTIPTYNGEIPTKEDDENNSYIFKGWTPAVTEVKEDMTYTATFISTYDGENISGVVPSFSNDKKVVQYGFYPQSYVSDSSLISLLNTLQPLETNGWYLYEGNYYVKEKANVFKGESYAFDDGTSIVNEIEYWFKCEPISWNVLSGENGIYYLVSSMLLDTSNYYKDYSNRIINDKTIYANNYEKSDIRKWLNEDFFYKAFAFNDTNVLITPVDNTASSTDSNNNQYICNSTNDKVYLPSYQDYQKLDYGFDNISSRECKTTDYIRVRGAWCNTEKYTSSYWTRSPSSEYYYCAWNVNSGGYLSTYAVDGNSHAVRPAISIVINE